MRKLLISTSALVLLLNCFTFKVNAAIDAGTLGEVSSTSAQATAKSYNSGDNSNVNAGGTVVSSEGATPVKYTAEDDDGGVDYSDDAGDDAAVADMALTVASVAVPLLIDLLKENRAWLEFIQKWITSNTGSAELIGSFVLWEYGWFPIYFSFNPFETLVTLGHAAINKYMRDATYITASFVGAQGHVTDKWVGEPNTNQTIAILGDFEVGSQRFSALSFNAEDYSGLADPSSSSARELMDYRNDLLVEEQRSLKNVTEDTWGIHYRAQQRAITALATALQAKEYLATLAEVDGKITADYSNKTTAVSTVASRRILYDALMFLKMNVMAARTKMRAETMELDFKPVETDPTGDEDENK